jgi:hypothetical protein
MQELYKSKSMKLLNEFYKEGIEPLEKHLEGQDDKNTDAHRRLELYKKLFNTMQENMLNHFYYMLGLRKIEQLLQNNKQEDFDNAMELMRKLINIYIVDEDKKLVADPNNPIKMFKDSMNDNDIDLFINATCE